MLKAENWHDICVATTGRDAAEKIRQRLHDQFWACYWFRQVYVAPLGGEFHVWATIQGEDEADANNTLLGAVAFEWALTNNHEG